MNAAATTFGLAITGSDHFLESIENKQRRLNRFDPKEDGFIKL